MERALDLASHGPGTAGLHEDIGGKSRLHRGQGLGNPLQHHAGILILPEADQGQGLAMLRSVGATLLLPCHRTFQRLGRILVDQNHAGCILLLVLGGGEFILRQAGRRYADDGRQHGCAKA